MEGYDQNRTQEKETNVGGVPHIKESTSIVKYPSKGNNMIINTNQGKISKKLEISH